MFNIFNIFSISYPPPACSVDCHLSHRHESPHGVVIIDMWVSMVEDDSLLLEGGLSDVGTLYRAATRGDVALWRC